MLKTLFFISVIFILYAYFIYPISIYIIGFVRKDKKNILDGNNPYVTIIITAFNEEKRIKRKIENTLAITYPKEILQIIVSSDGSNDKTTEIVETFREKGIELLDIGQRGGKENAQKESLKYAKGEIIVFTDVATMLDPSGVEQIVSNFADPTIGCVSSEDQVVGKDGKQSGENFYVRYEMWLRRMESKANSPVGLSGSFFAARKMVCQDFSEDMDSDFRTLLNTVKMGMRGTIDPKALGYYLDVSDPRLEFERKVRTILRGITLFFRNTEFLNIFKYGLFSYQYFCHKLLRWLVPFFLIIAFITNFFLATTSKIYFILIVGQMLFYGPIILTKIYDVYSSSWKILKIPVYFIIVNASIFVAWWRYLRQQRIVMWTPSDR
jgi:glycosyltransferase involved in cell wall biosynthesis